MIRYVGLDVHKRVVQACILDALGNVQAEERLELSAEKLRTFVQTSLTPEDHVILEATTNTWAIVDVLRTRAAKVFVSNPIQTKAIAQAKVKTDKVDARVLAQLLRLNFVPLVWEPDAVTRDLRRWTRHRAGLVRQTTLLKNRIHSVLHQRLIQAPMDTLFGKGGRRFLGELVLDEEGRWLIDSDLRLLEAVEEEIARVDQILAKKGHIDPRVKLLMTMPGVSLTVAQCLVAALGDISRFRDGNHAASYLGLVPSIKQSAEHCYHGPITKAGRGHARWMMIQAAQHVRLHAGPLGVFFRRLTKKKNYNVAVVAAARKLVTIAWHMLTHNEPYRYARPQPTQAKLARLRIKATGRKRQGGTAKGSHRSQAYGTGVTQRVVKSLHQVLTEEGLPPLAAVPAGEARTIREAGCSDYVAGLSQNHLVPRQPRQGDAIQAAEEVKPS
jgi:transposase